MNEALRDWVSNVENTFYIIGTAAGPHPYPAMVRDFQSVIGKETRAQMLEREGRLPDSLVACIGGGSNALGLFHPFLDDEDIRIIGVEAGGLGLETLRPRRPACRAANPVFCMATEPTFCRMRTVRLLKDTPFPPVSITRASDPNMPGCGIWDGSNMSPSRMTKRWTLSSFARGLKELFRHWNQVTPWRMSPKSPLTCPAITSWS